MCGRRLGNDVRAAVDRTGRRARVDQRHGAAPGAGGPGRRGLAAVPRRTGTPADRGLPGPPRRHDLVRVPPRLLRGPRLTQRRSNRSPIFARTTPAAPWTSGWSTILRYVRMISSYRSRPALAPSTYPSAAPSCTFFLRAHALSVGP